MLSLEDFFDAIKEMREKANANAVYGEPIQVGEKTVIPVADIKYGFGLGYGAGPTEEEDSDAQGGGVGGGVAATPVAVIEITADAVTVVPVTNEDRIALAGILTAVWSIFWVSRIIMTLFGKR